MDAISLPSLPLLLTMAALLIGGVQAAFLQELAHPKAIQESNPMDQVQSYESFHSYPLEEDQAKNQDHNQYQPQGELTSPSRVKGKNLFFELEEIVAVNSESCANQYNLFKMIDCSQVKKLLPNAQNEILTFTSSHGPGNSNKISARCDMETDGGGWTVIQRRVPDGGVNFTRDWDSYENGFGDLNGEFWYGLRNIHCLTTQEDVELRIDMLEEKTNDKIWWTYQTFKVAGAGDKYRLTIEGGQGNGGIDAMHYHNNMQFSTHEENNSPSMWNCALTLQGGWWYNNCYFANLNGAHRPSTFPHVDQGGAKIRWKKIEVGSDFFVLSTVEMKIRVKNFHK